MLKNQAIYITNAIPIQYQYIANIIFILVILILLWAILKFFIYRYRLGNILLKLPIKGQGIVIFSYIIILMNIGSPILDKQQLFNYPLESYTRIILSIYLLLRLLMNNPPSIRDKGILTVGGLVKWKQVHYYKWSINAMNPNEHILIITTGFFFWNIWRLTIHNKQKNNVDSVLKEYLILEK